MEKGKGGGARYGYKIKKYKLQCLKQLSYQDMLYSISQEILTVFYNLKWNINFKIVNHYVVWMKHIHQHIHQLYLNFFLKARDKCC